MHLCNNAFFPTMHLCNNVSIFPQCTCVTEEDKKKDRDVRPVKGKQSRASNPSNPCSDDAGDQTDRKSPVTPPSAGGRRSNSFKMTLPAVAPTPDIPDDESEEEGEEIPSG